MSDEAPKITPVSTTRGTRAKHLDLRIVLDTNQLFTGSASDLLRQEVKSLIEESKRHRDVLLRWFLPQVVILERQHQMMEAAQELLPGMTKLERLLGHSLGINKEILDERVKTAIDRQISALELTVLSLDASKVDWSRIIEDSASRQPPFEQGKHEKGFRDSIVAETFLQLVDSSPKNASFCRVILVTGDGLLAETVENRTKGASNVRILRSIDEIRDLINTVVADVTEEFVQTIRDSAQKCFFEKENKDTLYYRASVSTTISNKFEGDLKVLPAGAHYRRNGTWYIGSPRFSRKKRQKINWVTTITVSSKAFKRDSYSIFGMSPPEGAVLPPLFGTQPPGAQEGNLNLLGGGLSPLVGRYSGEDFANPSSGSILTGSTASILPQIREVLVAEGQTKFEVQWSVTVTSSKKLINASVDDVRYIDTTWTNVSST